MALEEVKRQLDEGVEFFLTREAAEAMIAEVREDEPELAEPLEVVTVEFRRRAGLS